MGVAPAGSFLARPYIQPESPIMFATVDQL